MSSTRIFGAPVAHEDDSERAVLAALAIQRALARYADEVEAAYGVRLAARIGINTGPVVVSPAEDGDGTDPWNALGDTVNVAARLQTLAPSGGIVVGDADEAPGGGLLRARGARRRRSSPGRAPRSRRSR